MGQFIEKDPVVVKAMVHSKQAIESVTILDKKHGVNSYVVKTEEGIICSAIFNPFTGLYYADDLYGVIE